jgi:Zn-dependent protease with chaperone function
MTIKIHKRENAYFAIKVAFTLVVLVAAVALIALLSKNSLTAMSSLTVFIVYAAMIWALILFQKIYLVAYMKGNGIAVTERQFPEVFAIYQEMGRELGLKKIPRLFIIQQGGALNAFAIRFSGKNYVAIYSDIFSLISTDIDAVKFVLGHELGHVKRNHMSKRFWTFPSSIIPFLTATYSRSCEYTCDNIGDALADNRSLGGLLVLAAGKELYKQVNVEGFIEDARANNSFAVKLVGLCMSHPYLPRRIANLRISR